MASQRVFPDTMSIGFFESELNHVFTDRDLLNLHSPTIADNSHIQL